MLENKISWYGKLPSYVEFIQSYNDITIETILMKWIQEGQNHIGEQLLSNIDLLHKYFYIFSINSLYNNIKGDIHGILFTSTDQKGRSCPFIIFTRNTNFFYNGFMQVAKRQLSNLDCNFLYLNNEINSQNITNSLQILLNEEQTTTLMDYWVQFYPNHNPLMLHVDRLTSIVYRKLVAR